MLSCVNQETAWHCPAPPQVFCATSLLPCYYPYYHVSAALMHTLPVVPACLPAAVVPLPSSALLSSVHARRAIAASHVGFHPERSMSVSFPVSAASKNLLSSRVPCSCSDVPTRSLAHSLLRDGKSDKTFSEVAAFCRNSFFTCFPSKCPFF